MNKNKISEKNYTVQLYKIKLHNYIILLFITIPSYILHNKYELQNKYETIDNIMSIVNCQYFVTHYEDERLVRKYIVNYIYMIEINIIFRI